MKLIRTISIKLSIPKENILPSIQAYTNAYNYISQIGFDKNIYDGFQLHKLVYKESRELFNLPSQLAISARMKAIDSLKSVKTLRKIRKNKNKTEIKAPHSKQQSIRLDERSYSINWKKNQVSILTISGRKKYDLKIADYYKQYLSWEYTSAELLIKKNKVWLKIVFQKEINDFESNGNLIGIDRGINKLAVTSNNKFFGGGKVKHIVNKRRKQRTSLQSKKTKSAKRHLRKLSGKERRFKEQVNHIISKQIVSFLNPGDTIVIENLTGIRNNIRARKKLRTAINGWNFYQLELFLTYKAEAKGIRVVHIDPRYTSQRCSKCGSIDKKNRKNQSIFDCRKCGFKHNADLNAAKNICLKYLDSTGYPDKVVINQPNSILARKDKNGNVSIEISGTNNH